MTINTIITHLETFAPLSYQESYDNAGLITGSSAWPCSGVLICMDTTEAIIEEAIARECNLVIAHHPVIFKGLKKITGKNYVEKVIINAIKNDVAIYAIHTNLDNVQSGVNGKMADRLGLVNRSVLQTIAGTLKKLITFVPLDQTNQVRDALFKVGGGHIGNYSECSFSSEGTGTFKAGEHTHPFTGKPGERHYEKECKIEVIFPAYLQDALTAAMITAHPYEEAAYDIIELVNRHSGIGAGLIGELENPVTENDFLEILQQRFHLKYLRHSRLCGKPVKKVAVCGGAGSFLLPDALAGNADFFVTSDLKYHEFFDANDRIVIADIGHYESEQFTTELLSGILKNLFPTFAVLKTELNTNPVHYFPG